MKTLPRVHAEQSSCMYPHYNPLWCTNPIYMWRTIEEGDERKPELAVVEVVEAERAACLGDAGHRDDVLEVVQARLSVVADAACIKVK